MSGRERESLVGVQETTKNKQTRTHQGLGDAIAADDAGCGEKSQSNDMTIWFE